MLQQTQVATVLDYFRRFIDHFPTLQSLADADEQQVLTLWQGLGYYRRARHLHAAARLIVAEHGGVIPGTVEQLLKLPGVGNYTAGAIASIAFGKQAPILDGNVARVLSRWFAVKTPIDEPATKAELWRLAAVLTPAKHPGDFNQAMMDLGATVCTPRSPSCLTCPMAAECQAHAAGMADKLPVRLPRTPPREVTHHIVAVEHQGQWLLERRPDKGLWSRMWQMPTAEDWPQAVDADHIRAWMHDRTGLKVRLKQLAVDSFTHQTTHRTIRFVVHHATTTGGRLRDDAGAWRTIGDISDLPLAKPQQRVAAWCSGRG